MMAANSDVLPLIAIALILAVLAARTIRKQRGHVRKRPQPRITHENHSVAVRVVERPRVRAPKKCPSCAKELMLSAIICDGCDYNFLAERPDRGARLLPAPEHIIHDLSMDRIVATGS